MNDPIAASTDILCVAMGWFPTSPGGLNRYVYELTHHLAAGQERVELCGVGVPEAQLTSLVRLNNLASPNEQMWRRLWDIRSNFLNRQAGKPDAINLHFALYSLPLLNILTYESQL